MKKVVILAALTAVLAACGGGGGGGETAASAETQALAGIYTGTATDGQNTVQVLSVLLETGEMYALYGESEDIYGGLFGKISAKDGILTAKNGFKDYGLEDSEILRATLSGGSYVTESKLQGTMKYAAPIQDKAFDLTYQLNSNAVPEAAYATGDWSVTDSDGAVGTFTVAADGSLTGTGDEGCTFTGKLTPVKAAYKLTLTMGSGCEAAGKLTGVAIPGGNEQLVIVTLHSSGQGGLVAVARQLL